MGEVFLSYKSEDRARAARLVRALEESDIDVWWDQHIGAGDAWRQQIGERLDAARCVVVLWTKTSVGPAGGFVQDEAARAERRGTYLPVTLDDVELPLGFGARQALSLVGWRGNRDAAAFATLLAKVREMIGGDAPKAAVPLASQPGRRTVLIGGAAAAALAAGGVFLAVPATRCRLFPCATDTPEPVALPVLPFRNLSGNPDADFLADGITEEIRNAIARAGTIRVAARTSSNTFTGADLDMQAAARKLGVGWLLDGSVRNVDGKVRVNTTLVEAESGFEKWSESYDREMQDVLALQSEIASTVATTLQGSLDPQSSAAVARLPTANSQAFEAYLRGRKLLDLASDLETDRAALALFDQAVALDPGYAGAHAARARTLQAIANSDPDLTQQRANYNAALSAAQRAVALDPQLAAAQSTLGYILMYGRLDFPAAREPFAKARDSAPDDADILIRYGLFHARVADMKTGLAALKRATELDPLNPRAFRAHSMALYAARQHRAAIAVMKKGLALNPALSIGHATIGDALLQLGELPAAIAEYRLEPLEHIRHTGLAVALRKAGQTAGAEAEMAALRQTGENVWFQVAQVLAQWGDSTAAMDALDKALVLRDAGLPLLRDDPFLDPLRGLPRFQAFQRKLNFG